MYNIKKAVFVFLYFSIFLTSTVSDANEINSNELKGVVYFSDGGSLIKYDFSVNKSEMLFKYREESELGKRITHITYPSYLKNKNRIIFVGSKYPDDYIFESDLNLENWKKYANTKIVQVLSVSPDENTIAYYKHPNELVIKKYEDLEKDGQEQIVAENIANSSGMLWLSNTELVFNSIDKNIIKVDINDSKQQILIKGAYMDAVSPDKKFILCSNKDSISLYNCNTHELRLLKKTKGMFRSIDVWSPDGKYLLFSKLREVKFTLNIFKFWDNLLAEYQDLYAYRITTGEEIKLLDNSNLFGGFWLESDSDQRK